MNETDFRQKIVEVVEHLKNERPDLAESGVHQLSSDLRKGIQPWHKMGSTIYPWQKVSVLPKLRGSG